MAQKQVMELACNLMRAPIGKIRAWANCYAAGERISWHKDCVGDIQLLLLLAAAHSPDMSLWLRGRAGPRPFPLTPGDAVLFSGHTCRARNCGVHRHDAAHHRGHEVFRPPRNRTWLPHTREVVTLPGVRRPPCDACCSYLRDMRMRSARHTTKVVPYRVGYYRSALFHPKIQIRVGGSAADFSFERRSGGEFKDEFLVKALACWDDEIDAKIAPWRVAVHERSGRQCVGSIVYAEYPPTQPELILQVF